jgi:hypothetical protein
MCVSEKQICEIPIPECDPHFNIFFFFAIPATGREDP